jgi:hypothetical protein
MKVFPVALFFIISCAATPPTLCPGCTPRQRDSLQTALEAVAGKEALNCGTLEENAASEKAIAAQQRCISDAIASGKPFIAKRQPMGVDSLVVYAVAGNGAGAASYIFYDSSPCGATDCGERIVVKSCTFPVLSSEKNAGYTCR